MKIQDLRARDMEAVMEATCQCGRLSVTLPGPTSAVVACHCGFCQRRSGSPFGLMAYYRRESVKIKGEATRYERPTDSGGVFQTFFCPTCGATLYACAAKHPTILGVPVGAIADAAFPPPARSVWEVRKHPWVTIPEPAEHFLEGRPPVP